MKGDRPSLNIQVKARRSPGTITAIKVHLLLQFSLHHMANWQTPRSSLAHGECWNYVVKTQMTYPCPEI